MNFVIVHIQKVIGNEQLQIQKYIYLLNIKFLIYEIWIHIRL